MLQSLLKTTERVVQEIDSVEYGLTDIQAGHPPCRFSYPCWLCRLFSCNKSIIDDANSGEQ